MSKLKVIFSVDWEPDHGVWKYPETETDYGGILRGTPSLCALLDELRIPCTWFIETSHEPKRDLPHCCREQVEQLAARKRDEIGLHIHWRRSVVGESAVYETSDPAWVSEQIDHGVRGLSDFGLPPRAFRSGALLHVPQLARMLGEKGFLVDSSTLWGRANRLTPDKTKPQLKSSFERVRGALRRVFGSIPEPYLADHVDVEKCGTSRIVELPITYSIVDASRPSQNLFDRYVRFEARFASQTKYLMLFFHIDELTSSASGPDDRAELNSGMLQHFRSHLTDLQKNGAQFFTCWEARTRWLAERGTQGAHKVAARELTP